MRKIEGRMLGRWGMGRVSVTMVVVVGCVLGFSICVLAMPQKCDTGNVTKCAADASCACVKIKILPGRCSTPCPQNPGYRSCVGGQGGDTCDPNKTTKAYCQARGWPWDGPGNPASCPATYDCTTDTPAATYKTDAYHASCD
jgi:hypothetical protein